jgi:hypothetical protein
MVGLLAGTVSTAAERPGNSLGSVHIMDQTAEKVRTF